MTEYSDPHRLVTLGVGEEEATLEVPSEEGTVWYGFTFGSPTVRVKFPAASLKYLVPDEVLDALAGVLCGTTVQREWLRHIIEWEGECGCLIDTGDYMDTPIFACKLWEDAKGDDSKFKVKYGVTYQEWRDIERRAAEMKNRRATAARNAEKAAFMEKWGHLLP